MCGWCRNASSCTKESRRWLLPADRPLCRPAQPDIGRRTKQDVATLARRCPDVENARSHMDSTTKADPDHSSNGARRIRAVATIILLAALWLSTRPYFGIIHDSRLYTLQALAHIDPGRLSRDLYLAYGSQDSFTIFSAIYAPLIQAFGLPAAHATGVFVGHLVWLSGLLMLVTAMFGPGRERVAGLAGAILLSPSYGYLAIFAYGEPFLTPRLFAEAAGMTALGLAIRGSWWGAGAGVLVGIVLHPLMVLPAAMAAAFIAWSRHPPIWRFLIVLPVPALALAAAGVEPFARIGEAFDQAWWTVVRERNALGVLAAWGWPDWTRTASVALTLLCAHRIATPREREAIIAVGMIAVLGLLATAIGGDALRNVLVVNLQPWRALWLTTLTANIWALVLALRLPRGRAGRQFMWLAVGTALLERWIMPLPIASTACLALACAAIHWEARGRRPLPRAAWLMAATIATAVLLVVGALLPLLIRQSIRRIEFAPFVTDGFALMIGAALTIMLWHSNRSLRVPLLASCLLLAGALATHDRRSDWDMFASNESVPADLRDFISESDNIYWQQGISILWMKLRMPGAWSCLHGSGAMFYRTTALEYQRRAIALSRLNTNNDFIGDGTELCPARLHRQFDGPGDREDLVEVCKSLPELDSVVLLRPVEGITAMRWQPPVPIMALNDKYIRTTYDAFYQYRCASLR